MLQKYEEHSIYLIAYSSLPKNIAAAKLMDVVGVGVIVDYTTDKILDMSCTLLTDEARMFLKEIIVGRFLNIDNLETLIKDVEFRFHGMSQKAICVALKQVFEKYCTWQENQELAKATESPNENTEHKSVENQ